jgi:hypothetical protein
MKTKLLIGFFILCSIVKAQTNFVLNFNGTSNYVNMGSDVASNIRSIEFWFKPSANINSSLSQTNVFVGRNDATESSEYGFYIQGAEYPAIDRGKVTFYIANNSNYYSITSNNNSWAAGTWYHVCGTIDAISGMKLYIDGVQQTSTNSYSSVIPQAPEITALGRWGDLSIRYFSGRMDELRFWNRTLSQSEIQQKKCSSLNPSNETGLVGYWQMDEGSGSAIYDATANANPSTIIGATFIQELSCSNIETNYALNFNGTSNYVNMGNAVASNIRSVEFWFKPSANINSSLSQTNVFVGRNDATESSEYGFYIQGAEYPAIDRGKVTFYIADNGNYYSITSNNNSWTAGTWYHVCGTIDATNGMKLYVDGVQQTSTNSYSNAIPAAAEITAIGRWGDLSIRYFSGRMDELRFWNRTLTQSEIQQKKCFYLNPVIETGLVGYWKMNEGTGTTIFDATTGANSGIISGATFIQDLNCFTGTVDLKNLSDIDNASVFPNPFSFATTFKSSEELKDASLSIQTLLGQEVKQINNISGNEITIERGNLPAGIYFISISQNNKRIILKKVLITDN